MIKLKDILNEEWSDKYKRSIDCDNPKGFSQKAHCQGREKKESVNELMLPRDVDSKMKELGISKIPISSQGEKVLNGMVKEKFLDKVTNKERLIYFVESLGKEKFGYGSKGKLLSPLVDRFWNDITSDGIYFGGKMAAYQVAMNIKDMKRNGEEIDSSYEMMKEYFKNFGMNHSGSRVFDSALRNLGEWMKRNKIEESVNEAVDITSLKKIHDAVFKFLKTKKGVGEVKEFSEFPNRYGDNVSTFSVKYNIEDKYNYDLQEIKIEYSTSRVFIPNKGYFPFKTFNDIKNIINKKSSLKESVNEVGSGDWHFKAIKKLWDKAGDFTKKKIAVLITKNPKATWDRIEKELRGSDYDDVTYYTDMLHLESINEQSIKLFEENVPTDPEKWAYAVAQAKKKFDVYPSAYANGWASKKYKELGGDWKTEESIKETFTQSIRNLFGELVPRDVYNAITPQQVERRKAFVRDLVKTLNNFYKQHGIDWKFTDTDFKFKMYSKN